MCVRVLRLMELTIQTVTISLLTQSNKAINP